VARFIQTREEMARILNERGLKDTVLNVLIDNPRTITGDALAQLLPSLVDIDMAAVNLERRGSSLEAFLAKAKDGVFPMFHVRFGGKEHWFHSSDEVTEFRKKQGETLGKELVHAADLAVTSGVAADDAARYTLDEWHELRGLNRAAKKLLDAGFTLGDLIPLPRIAGREPPVRFLIEREGSRKELSHLRELVAEIRHFGEKGITVTRFKGLGEMDPDELWDTTLDPMKRTMMKVTMENAAEAEKLFRTLMGEEVEGRRAFIMANKIDSPEDIDYGA
jgi:DNA gyrase subunit B